MAEIKISQLTAKGANLSSTDEFAIAEDDGAGGYVSKKITGAEISAIAGGTNIYLVDGVLRSDRTIEMDGYYLVVQNGSTDVFKISAADVISFNNAYSFPTADGTSAQVLKTDGAGSLSFGSPTGLYAQTTQSATVNNTTTETSIIGTGVGGLTIPANLFLAGDSYHGKIGGVVTAQNGDDITINIKTGSTVLATTGTISLESVTSLGWECELDFTIASIGATGSICTNGNFAYNRNTGSLEGFVFQDVQTLDTTVSNTLDITVTWGQAKIQDSIYSANFVLYKTY